MFLLLALSDRRMRVDKTSTYFCPFSKFIELKFQIHALLDMLLQAYRLVDIHGETS